MSAIKSMCVWAIRIRDAFDRARTIQEKNEAKGTVGPREIDPQRTPKALAIQEALRLRLGDEAIRAVNALDEAVSRFVSAAMNQDPGNVHRLDEAWALSKAGEHLLAFAPSAGVGDAQAVPAVEPLPMGSKLEQRVEHLKAIAKAARLIADEYPHEHERFQRARGTADEADVQAALDRWQAELRALARMMQEHWPERGPSFQKVMQAKFDLDELRVLETFARVEADKLTVQAQEQKAVVPVVQAMPVTDTPNSVAGWLGTVATAVHELASTTERMERFRTQVTLHYDEQDKRDKVIKRQERLHDEYFDGLRERHRKQGFCETLLADPPHPDWVWKWFYRRVKDETTRKTIALDAVPGWTPPILANEITHPQLLPLPQRKLTLSEVYTILSVIHDGIYKGTDLIDPFAVALPKPCSLVEECHHHIRHLGYQELVKAAQEIPSSDAVSVDALLRTVRTDFKAVGLIPTVAPQKVVDAVVSGEGKLREPLTLPKLGEHDKEAWKLSLLGKTQSEIASMLNSEHDTSYKQGQVSRMIKRAMKHAEASGLTDLIPKPAEKVGPFSPDSIELGKRADRHTLRQREPKPDLD